MNELAGMDFQARSSKLWFLEPEEAIAFKHAKPMPS